MMMRSVVDINWNDNEIVLPAFLTIVLMPFTYSIADGIAWGVITYVAIKVGTQKTSELNPIVWTIAILMTMFLKFHIMLALQGKTTIESLEKRSKPYVSDYDNGPLRNWMQIFGQN